MYFWNMLLQDLARPDVRIVWKQMVLLVDPNNYTLIEDSDLQRILSKLATGKPLLCCREVEGFSVFCYWSVVDTFLLGIG